MYIVQWTLRKDLVQYQSVLIILNISIIKMILVHLAYLEHQCKIYKISNTTVISVHYK